MAKESTYASLEKRAIELGIAWEGDATEEELSGWIAEEEAKQDGSDCYGKKYDSKAKECRVCKDRSQCCDLSTAAAKSEEQAPAPATDTCIACRGTGKNTRGRACPICAGNGVSAPLPAPAAAPDPLVSLREEAQSLGIEWDGEPTAEELTEWIAEEKAAKETEAATEEPVAPEPEAVEPAGDCYGDKTLLDPTNPDCEKCDVLKKCAAACGVKLKGGHAMAKKTVVVTVPAPKAAPETKVAKKVPAAKAEKAAPAKVGRAPKAPAFADDAKIKLLVKDNPKRGTAAARFALYKTGMTVGEYIAAGGKIEDIKWDSKQGWISVK